ncbi:S1/P1 nuclease [Chloracidobacterium validum]|uniref:S1/P1 nuclease n=1 Tax=Chloracidobacterium validum TaxID=2821543 RepID=A0ABX8B5D9_9BACT|nr:S1/P1 nuclease [Chloracidobacterium validum]QUW02183.1 S1/P1 nuclease [Chloracidobacterium validum]
MLAWNQAGHATVAAIAYAHLTPRARARVDAILKQHPEYAEWTRDVSPAQASLAAFLSASYWVDDIKFDRRQGFSDREPPPSVHLAYPDMRVHGTWHYLNRPLAAPGVSIPLDFQIVAADGGALGKIVEIEDILRHSSPDSPRQSYYLAWLIHLVGDVHQPLHTVARCSKNNPQGDQGGNLFIVRPTADTPLDGPRKPNLHAFWDNAALDELSLPAVQALARELARSRPARRHSLAPPTTWIDESAQLAKDVVYQAGDDDTPEPPVLSESYKMKAKAVARERVRLAGFRLAAMLNRLYDRP